MYKFAVVLSLFSTLQAGVHRHHDVINEIVSISSEIYENFCNHTGRAGLTYENQELIDKVIDHLDELINKYDASNNETTFDLLEQLSESSSYLRELYTCSKNTTSLLKSAAIQSVKAFATFDSVQKDDIKTLLELLRKLHGNVRGEYKHVENNSLYTSHSFCGTAAASHNQDEDDIRELAARFESTLLRLQLSDDFIKRAFVRFVKQHFKIVQKHLSQEAQEYYRKIFLQEDDTFYTALAANSNVSSFAKVLLHASDRAELCKFEQLLNIIWKISEPVNKWDIRIQTSADRYTNWYETLPYYSDNSTELITEHAKSLRELFGRCISRIEVYSIRPECITNMKRIVSYFDHGAEQKIFVVVIQELVTEVRKIFLSHPEATALLVGGEFFNSLESISDVFIKIGDGKDIESLCMYMTAYANRISLYTSSDGNTTNTDILMDHFDKALKILEATRPIYVVPAFFIKKAIEKFKTKEYTLNNLLQVIVLELNALVWNIYQQNQTSLLNEASEVLHLYVSGLEKTLVNQRVVTAFATTVQTPEEIILAAETVVDRVTNLLQWMVPRFKQTSIALRVHYFVQVLELVTYRLHKVSNTTDPLISEVYENLHQIEYQLKKVVEDQSVDPNTLFGLYVQDVLIEFKKLAGSFTGPEFVQIYNGFLFDSKYLLNQLQFDFQYVTEHYNVSTILNLQIDRTAYRIWHLLERTESKPQDSMPVILLQVRAMTQELETLIVVFKRLSDQPIFSELYIKYRKIYSKFDQVIKIGWNRSVEELCAFLDFYINTIVHDWERLTLSKLESPEYNAIYRNMLVVFNNIMARLENFRYYELNTRHFV